MKIGNKLKEPTPSSKISLVNGYMYLLLIVEQWAGSAIIVYKIDSCYAFVLMVMLLHFHFL
jgi:hypothetical protein